MSVEHRPRLGIGPDFRTPWRTAGSRPSSDTGIALVAVLLLLVLVSALSAALALSATTETLVARNHQAAIEARAAADAGLAHAIDLVMTQLRRWRTDGFATVEEGMTALLAGPDGQSGSPAADADNGSLGALGLPGPPARIQLPGSPPASYEAWMADDDDPARRAGLRAEAIARIGENGDAYADANRRVVVLAIGHAAWNARAEAEAVLTPAVLPAIVAGDALLVSGHAVVGGPYGGVHANGDLTLAGSPSIAKDATASFACIVAGTPAVGGVAAGGRRRLAIPDVRAPAYLAVADVVLKGNGLATTRDGIVLCDAAIVADACAAAGYGWLYAGPRRWLLQDGGAPSAGTYYIEGSGAISGSPGTSESPLRLSVVAEDDVEISGSPSLVADAEDLLLLAGGDIRIDGAGPTRLTGWILAREQIYVGGTTTIAGSLVAAGAGSVRTLVDRSTIADAATVVHDGTSGVVDFRVSSWRILQP